MITTLTEKDKILLEEIQKDFPLVSRPFDHIGSVCYMTEDEVIKKIASMISKGVIREISAIFNANALGYKSILVAVEAPEDSIESIANEAASIMALHHIKRLALTDDEKITGVVTVRDIVDAFQP